MSLFDIEEGTIRVTLASIEMAVARSEFLPFAMSDIKERRVFETLAGIRKDSGQDRTRFTSSSLLFSTQLLVMKFELRWNCKLAYH